MSGYANDGFDGEGMPSDQPPYHRPSTQFHARGRRRAGGSSGLSRHALILVSLISLALFFFPSTARAADLVLPELADVIMSLQVVSGRTVPQARDVTNDGKIDMSDALYSMQYVVRQIWADPATELAVAETLEEETLTPRDSAVSGISPADEDALARAIVAANEADLQSVILYNSFYMVAESTPAATLLNRYRAMMKSFEIAEGKYDEIIRIHEGIEAADIRTAQQLPRAALELNVDPKLQWYIDNYGKTTPGGHKIDVKTIAERNKISVRKAYSVLKTHYSVVAEQENAKAIQYEAAEKTATEIKIAADTANTALSFVAGGQAALGVFKAAQTIRTTTKMYQAGALGYRTADYILRTQGKNIIQGAINGGFSFGDGIMGVLTNPALEGAFGPDGQANLQTAKTIWSGVSIAKGLTYDGYCLLSVKDAFTGQAKLVISNLTDFTKTTVDTTGHIISILQTPGGNLTQAVQRPENPAGESIRKDLVYKRLSPDNMLPNGDYTAKDENETETSFTVTASTAGTLLPNLSGDDLLIGNDGAVAAVAEPPYEHYCGWDVDVSVLTVYDSNYVRLYLNQSGQKHGPYYEWLDSTRNELQYAGCYFEDNRHGTWIEWGYDQDWVWGRKIEQSSYYMDKLEGLSTTWYVNGTKESEGNYSAGVRDGIWHWWYDDGTMRIERSYVQGLSHGPITRWQANGNLLEVGQYTNGQESGIWTYYYEDGSCRFRHDKDTGQYLDCE